MREQTLLHKGTHRPKGESTSVKQGQKQEPGHGDSLSLRMDRVTLLMPTQMDTWRPSGSQGHMEEGCTVVLVARTVLTSLQPLHNQGHGRH